MTKVQHKERAHALLSASGASRWINCTASPRLEENFESKEDSDFAAEGTLAHELGEVILRQKVGILTVKQTNEKVNEIKANRLWQDEMTDYVFTYIDYVLAELATARKITKDAVLLIEDKINLTELIEEGFGTCDAGIIADGCLQVIDLKYGKGIKVSAKDNAQLKLYAYGMYKKYELAYDIETVQVTIVQPRLDHVDSWEISVVDLLDWAENVVRPAAQKAYLGEGEQCAGDWCKWCKAKAKCRALADLSLDAAKQDFEETKLLSDSELLEVYHQLDRISDWVQAVWDYVLAEAIKGKEWEGLKLVEGKSNRVWADTDKVISLLKDMKFTDEQIINAKIKGITDIEKLVGKARFTTVLNPFVTKPLGKPTLAPITDKRPVYSATTLEAAQSDFCEN